MQRNPSYTKKGPGRRHQQGKEEMKQFNSKPMNFGTAIEALKEGFAVKRKHWKSGKLKIYDVILPNDSGNKAYIAFVSETVSEYTPNEGDLLAEDWIIVE